MPAESAGAVYRYTTGTIVRIDRKKGIVGVQYSSEKLSKNAS